MADARFRVVVDRVRRQIVSHARGPLIAILMGLSGPLIMFTAQQLGVPLGLAIILLVMFMFIIGRLLVVRGMRRSAPAVATVMLADGLCPGCAYSLAGLGPGEDGCFECPECGAAWKATRVVRRTRFEEVAGSGVAAPVRWWQRIGGHVGLRRLKDDRGNDGPAADARLREAIRAATDPDRKERLLAVRRASTRDGMILRAGLFVLYSGLACFQIWIMVTKVHPRPMSWTGLLMVAGAIGFLWIALMFLRSNAGIRGKTLRREMLARGMCPRCAAEMSGLVVESDGCTICRECAAAWKRAACSEPVAPKALAGVRG